MKKRNIVILTVLLLFLILTAGMVYYHIVELPKIKEKEEQLRKYNEFYAQTVQGYSDENEKYGDFEVDIAFLGDSITAGYDVKNYYSEYLVANRGIGGETTHGLNNRLDVSVLDLKPKVCVMLIGGNNIDTMFEDYEDILITFKEKIPETQIVLVSLSPTGDPIAERNKTLAYNNVKIELLAEKYGYEFVDIYTPLFDLETGQMKAEYTPDGAHHTAAGYRVITEAVKPVVDKLLRKIEHTDQNSGS